MIFNMSTGGASTADKIKYDNTESGLQSTNVQGAVDELNNSLNGIVLWENPNMTANTFNPQTITLNENIENFKYYSIIFCLNNKNLIYYNSGKLPIDKTTYLTAITDNTLRVRQLESVGGKAIVFKKGTLTNVITNEIKDDNTICVPFQIIGQ